MRALEGKAIQRSGVLVLKVGFYTFIELKRGRFMEIWGSVARGF